MSKRSPHQKPGVRKSSPKAPPMPERAWRGLLPVVVIVAVWLVIAVLVDPRGNFPLNDDWGYGRAVFDLLKHHEIRFVGITTMTLFAQMLWGALFCLVLGPTFTALRISTLTLGLMGLLATYGILREIGAPRWAALFGTLVVALNPLYLCLSYSFMTDIPFAAVALMAMYAYLKALKTDSAGMIALGTALSVAAVLIRQFGIILPVGFAMAYVVKNGFSSRSLVRSVIPIAAVALTLMGYVYWLKASQKLPVLFNLQIGSTSEFLRAGVTTWGVGIRKVFVDCFVYLGGFLLPFLIPSFLRQRARLTPRQSLVNMCISTAALIAVGSTLICSRMRMPLIGNYLQDLGIGPPLLADVLIFKVPNYPRASESFWMVVTAACCLGGALLLWHLLATVELIFTRSKGNAEAVDKAGQTMLMATTAMCLLPMLPLTILEYYDRYFIFVIPLLVGVVCLAVQLPLRPDRIALSGGIIILLLIGYFSVAGTHDYMSWNRTRWQAIESLMASDHIPTNQIDGGYEFNNWYNYKGVSQDWWRDWWRAASENILVTFGPVDGYEVFREYSYQRWMPLGDASIYVLRKSQY